MDNVVKIMAVKTGLNEFQVRNKLSISYAESIKIDTSNLKFSWNFDGLKKGVKKYLIALRKTTLKEYLGSL